MNRREDPLLRQHCSRLLQLAETTNIKPGHGSGKRRSQRTSHGFTPSTSARITLQDIVRNDPGYTPNIEHLVFPDRNGSSSNLTSGTSSSKGKSSNPAGTIVNASTGRSRLVEVFARPYIRGSSLQDSVTARNNHFNSTSLDGGGSGGGVTTSSGHQPGSGSVSSRSTQRRWLSQTSQQSSSRQHSADDGGSHVGPVGVVGGTTSSSVQQPRRVSPASDPTEIANSAPASSVVASRSERSERASNVSILHLRGTSSAESWDTGQMSSFPTSTRSNSYTRTGSIPSLKRHETSATTAATNSVGNSSTPPLRNLHRRQETQSQCRRDATNSFLSGSGGTSGELFVSGNCSRELSPVRWCDREVDGVYLGRSGWVQVQQRSLDENRKTKYESNPQVASSGNSNVVTGTIPLPRRATVKLADYHCSNSEPGKCPDYVRSLTLDSHRPDFLKLHSAEYEPPSGCASPHSIPESPPSITPIISPPPAFQDDAKRASRSSRPSTAYAKAPFLPRSNAIIDSDVISPPPSPPLNKNWASPLNLTSRKGSGVLVKPRPRRQTPSQVSAGTQQLRQDSRQYRLASAKSLEDQSSTRRSQFAQRYRESSSSSSSSMGFRSLDSCVSRTTMPRLAENTDSSVEGYEDGDEDDNPDSSLNLSVVSSPGTVLDSSPEGKAFVNQERSSPSGRQSRLSRGPQTPRRSPGSSDAGKLSFDSSSSSTSTASSVERAGGRSPTPNHFKRSNQQSRQHQGFRNTLALSPDSLQTARVRRSRSLQLPEKRSPGSASHSQQVSREPSRESSDSNRVVVKIINDRSAERTKRHPLSTRTAQSTDEAINVEVHREPEIVTEYLYGTRSRPMTRNLHSGRYDSREDSVDRRGTSGPYDVYFISAKQPRQQQQQQQQQSNINYSQQPSNRRPRTLQRGATTPNTSAQTLDSKIRCNTSTCDFWPHCSQKETLYSSNQSQAFMKLSQSYPSHRRVSTDSVISHSIRDRGSACSSPAALDVVDDRDTRKPRPRSERGQHQPSKQEERLPKSALKHQSRKSPLGSQNGLDQATRWEYRNAQGDNVARRVSPVQFKTVGRSPSGGATSSITTSSSSSSDIWVTTSDRTVTKSPKNPKSSGGSTPMEDAIAGSLKTLQEPARESEQLRPGSAPAKRDDSPSGERFLEPHQRSSSLPKSFLTHDSGPDGEGLSVCNNFWRQKLN